MVLPSYLKIEDVAERRATMSFNSALGETYLEGMRISLHRGAGKSTVLTYIFSKIEKILKDTASDSKIKIADFGACEGDMLSQIRDRFGSKRIELFGFDYNENLISQAAKKYPDISFHHIDLNGGDFSKFASRFDIAFTVNTLHEVFSFAEYRRDSNEKRKRDVDQAIDNIASTIKQDGILLIYDGVESYAHLSQKIEIQVKDSQTEKLVKKFQSEYIPLKPLFKKVGDRKFLTNLGTFTRFITKLRFLDSVLWQIEKEESYQYFTKEDFIDGLWQRGFTTNTVVLLRPRLQMWKDKVKILTHNIDYPFEHILIISTKGSVQPE